MKQYDTIIIGGGPAGYTAALYGARAGLSVLVVESLVAGGQMATTARIDNYPGIGPGADGFSLGEKMQAGAEHFGAETLYAEVTAARLAETPKYIETSEGSFAARTVILATGAAPRRLGLAGETALSGKGIAYCATCDGPFYKGKTVAVVGGGNSAAADALYLCSLCQKVYLIHRRDTLRAGAASQKLLDAAANLEYIWNTRVTGFMGHGALSALCLENVQTGTRRELTVDGVFISIGRAANTALFAAQIETNESGYLVASEDTKTSIPGVFAAGDVRTKPLRQIITAAADGAVAATAAAAFCHNK